MIVKNCIDSICLYKQTYNSLEFSMRHLKYFVAWREKTRGALSTAFLCSEHGHDDVMWCHLGKCCQKRLCSTVSLILIFFVCVCQGGQSYWVFRSLLPFLDLWPPIPQIHELHSVRSWSLTKPGMCSYIETSVLVFPFISAFEQDLRFCFTCRSKTDVQSVNYSFHVLHIYSVLKYCLWPMSRLHLKKELLTVLRNY